ncbi:N-acetyltransferase family protein [Candidatus Poriferisodalis sp.]|uniref:GNAT family N-acetyltransferase n=1 Tax=Candidatus Poriferisodalis sp. TaxID=3101277 RepID=UPI003B0288F6
MGTRPAVRTRLATAADADAIAEIYNREVTQGTTTFDLVPRSSAEQIAWMREHSGAYPCIVAVPADDDAPANRTRPADAPAAGTRPSCIQTAGAVLGWASLSPYRARPAYSTSVEDSVYVHHEHRGRGIGDVLLGDLVALADEHGFHAVFARIADAGAASVALHARHGFELVGVEREAGRKFGRWLDVTLMQRLRPT